MQPEPERIYRAFSAIGEMRTITKAGYVRFRDYLLYGEQNLAGEKALVNMFQDVLNVGIPRATISLVTRSSGNPMSAAWRGLGIRGCTSILIRVRNWSCGQVVQSNGM